MSISQKKVDTVVLGAGAAGLMFGAHSKRELLFVDANGSMGAKIKVSGGGKCNLTNEILSAQNYLGDEAFVKRSLDGFGASDTLEFFGKYRVHPTIKKGGQYFCNSSKEVLSALALANASHKFLFGNKVLGAELGKEGFIVRLDGQSIISKNLIIASGGVSFPQLNATDIGYKIAQSFGHEISQPKPALVGLTLQKEQFWMKELSGVSLGVKISQRDFEYKGELLFSHFGISGPAVLNSSLRWERGVLEIDFLPDFAFDGKIWSDRKQPTSLLPLPKSFIKAFLSSVGLSDKPMNRYTAEEKERLGLLKKYAMPIAGTFGFKKAEVTKGGVKTEGIDPKTFESKTQKGLFFLGEVLDVTGELGGYNLQWAFASGALCARNFRF